MAIRGGRHTCDPNHTIKATSTLAGEAATLVATKMVAKAKRAAVITATNETATQVVPAAVCDMEAECNQMVQCRTADRTNITVSNSHKIP